eukprot:scaffold1290_cov248-Ochromonas_danica.AAC.14
MQIAIMAIVCLTGGYACPRGVGDESFQAENGDFSYLITDSNTQDTSTITQSKRMYYYSGSILPIEWTEQHGCGGNSKVSCEIILQVDNFWPWVKNKAENTSLYYGTQHFRSGTNIAAPRDGVPSSTDDAATDTITDSEDAAIPDSVADRRYGMHESYDYYQLCQKTERNKGLYTADQSVNRNDRRGTRQNPNGNRHGFECPEERDYYPWWAPSPWIDIAVLTDNAKDEVCYYTDSACTKRCEYYMNNTMNFHKKGYCDVARNSTVSVKLNHRMWTSNQWYNNRAACQKAGFVWYEVSHSDNLILANNSFVCARTQFSRVNQLGNAVDTAIVSQSAPRSSGVVSQHIVQGINANRFLWTVPNIPVARNGTKYFSSMQSAYKSCVLRARYNLSSADFQQWPLDAVDANSARMVDYLNNSKSSKDTRTPLHQDPYVYIGPGDSSKKGDQFVKLKVNTNQYSRTFQDRSYVFSIKPLPTASSTANNQLDTPAVDLTSIKAALAKGGKIYNVGVRGKRGNIVQVYPSVEYDFAPNALSLTTNDMIHFQWTGSDYNPRRGCNDAAGGPPDLNTYSTDANADFNPRADRSNFVLTTHMGYNVPKDYIGYNANDTGLSYSYKKATANDTLLENAPCYDPTKDSSTVAQQCYNTLMRLAYLNQQSDLGSLTLRANNLCLTQSELDAYSNQDVADYHPLNCAKLNAKPHPYFDGGIMFLRKNGWFPFFSSRNNNFSNRQQIGVLCVGGNCTIDNSTGVLQDSNPQTNGVSMVRASVSTCYDTASGGDGANSNAAHSCLPASTVSSSATTTSNIITVETFAIQEGDNDAKGDGNKHAGCSILSFNVGSDSVETDIALAFILLAVGLFTSWLAYYLYNRYQARRASEGKFRYDTAWQKAQPVEKNARPKSANFSQANPGIKMSRTSRERVSRERSTSPSRVPLKSDTSPMNTPVVSPRSSSSSKPATTSVPKIKRTEMI